MTVTTGVLDKSDGSAQITSPHGKVVVSVTGPIEAKPKQELINTSSLEVIVRPHQGLSSTREKLMEDKLRSLLQAVIVGYKYPRQVIQVVVQFLRNDSDDSKYTVSQLSDCVNAAFYALIDANVALYSSFVGTSLALVGGKLIHDPSGLQLQQSESHHLVCFSIEQGIVDKILLLESAGDFTQQELFEVVSNVLVKAEEVHSEQRKVLQGKVERDYVWRA